MRWLPTRLLVGLGSAWMLLLGSVLYGSGPAASAAPVIRDVRLDEKGCVRGVVFDVEQGLGRLQVANLRVRLVRDQRTVAVAAVGRGGEFVLGNVSAGLYRLAVDGCPAPGAHYYRHYYRVWPSTAAPPGAVAQLRVPIGNSARQPVIRGQYMGPFPFMSLQQAATITGIATGAIAAPVLYHNTLMDNRPPQSQ